MVEDKLKEKTKSTSVYVSKVDCSVWISLNAGVFTCFPLLTNWLTLRSLNIQLSFPKLKLLLDK